MTEKLVMLRTIGNRLVVALAVLVAIVVPGAILAAVRPGFPFATAPMAAFLVGVIGGFVGLQRRLRAMADDDIVLLAHSWVYVCLSPFVGGILAVVTYVLFLSGLLKGDLFPAFVADTDTSTGPVAQGFAVVFSVHGDSMAYAKMLFWCFIAGFSERFATDIISRFESKSGT